MYQTSSEIVTYPWKVSKHFISTEFLLSEYAMEKIDGDILYGISEVLGEDENIHLEDAAARF